MQIGISLQNNWGVEDVQSLVQLARKAEEWGFASVWGHDHVFNAAHVFNRIGTKPYYEPLTLLSYVAACTQRVGLGTSVLVLSYHNPSPPCQNRRHLGRPEWCRLILGVGVGGVPQESEAMGSPYAERAAITDESLAIMKELWTQEAPRYQGKYHRFADMPFSPKPLQKPHIPVLIGGNSHAAMRRAVRLGNGWHPFAISSETLREGIHYLREYAQQAGREVAEIPVSVSLPLGTPTPRGDALGTDAQEIVEKIQAFASIGVQVLVITGNSGNIAQTLSAMDMLAREVLPVFHEGKRVSL